jgi:hypothetical protein
MKVLSTLFGILLFTFGATSAQANLVVGCAKGYTFVEGQGCVQDSEGGIDEKQLDDHKELENENEKVDNKTLDNAED